MKRILICLAFITFSGCFTKRWSLEENTPYPVYSSSLYEEREKVLKKGAGPTYADGFEDGCSTARRAMGDKKFKAIKDKKRCAEEPTYKLGWDEGYAYCQDQGYEILKATSKERENHKDPMVSNWEILRK